MKFPITIDEIKYQKSLPSFSFRDIGKFVSIRPCGDNPDNKTFLGLYVGDIPLSWSSFYEKEERTLVVSRGFENPAIFVFDLNKIVYGAESWWGTIDTEDDLKSISNADINNIWYVKALKSTLALAKDIAAYPSTSENDDGME